MTEAYNTDEYAQGYPEGIELHFWHRARNDILYRQLSPQLEPDELVMDVGCGTGIVVSSLRQRGLNARGVELGPAPIAEDMAAHIRTGTDLFELDADTRNAVKVVLLLDVIEHVQERRQFLARIARELPNCRLLLITVPARMEIWSSFDEYWGHHLRYDRPGLEAELQGSGFTPRRTRYFFHWLYLASLARKLVPIERSPQFQPIAADSPTTLVHRLLAWFSRWEATLLPGPLVGSSLLCLAEREKTPDPGAHN
jgi:2-polyprenyl-3-methyl-5-hydroxy-6-metoxy-1,4-benzoquinol methylase